MALLTSKAPLESPRSRPSQREKVSTEASRCRKKFLRFFHEGFHDEKYLACERGYKWEAHLRWNEALAPSAYRGLLKSHAFEEIAARAVRIEARTNLLFSFEKMALRDAVKTPVGARLFAEGLFDFLHGPGALKAKFERWCETLAALPRKQTRVVTWPLVTIFGFLAQPERHLFLKPNVTRAAARAYGYDFHYQSRPSIETYESLLGFAERVRCDLYDLEPRDMIDVQSFLWVQGSSEYDE